MEYMKISQTMTINAPVDRVFIVFTDLDQAKKHISGIKHLEMIEGSAKMELGTRWKETREMMGKDSTEEMWVSELTQNTSYAVDAESHGTKYHSEFYFEGTGDSTNVTWMFEGTPQTIPAKIMNVVGIFFLGPLKKMMRKDLEDLKMACERG